MINRKRKALVVIPIVAIIILSPVIVIFSLNLFAWSSIFIGNLFSSNPPKPEITYAEFPFEIVYELEGETVTVNDVYVCEYDGIGMNEGVGKYREWKGYIKNSGDEHLILLEDGNLKLVCSLGDPEYYMGESYATIHELKPTIFYIKSHKLGGTSSGVLDIEPLLEQYKLKLISWKLSEPIQNSFK